MKSDRTEKQLEASRRNGAKSRGPVTPMGKRRSSRNALRHSRLACSFLLSMEDESQFRERLRELCEEHQPATPTEHELVESMALSRWQQYRIMNAAMVAVDERVEAGRQYPPDYKHQGAAIISRALNDLLEERPSLTRLNVERSRLERDYLRALSMLIKLQDRRLRLKGPAAEVPAAPVEQPEPELLDQPETSDQLELFAEPVSPLGLLPDEQIAKNIAENPAMSLKTNKPAQVRFREPNQPEGTHEGGTGFSLCRPPAAAPSTAPTHSQRARAA